MSNLNFKVERIYKLPQPISNVKAFVDLNINDELLLKGLRIVEGKRGLFVSMPQEQGKNKRWYDSIRCMTAETRMAIQSQVIAMYKE